MVSLAAWMFWHRRTPEEWDRINKAQAEESNRKFFIEVHDKLPHKIKSINLFNVLSTNEVVGFRAILALKKYPNVWARFSLTSEEITDTITFQLYNSEHKWVKYDLPLSHFLQMVEFHNPSYHYASWWKKIFGITEEHHPIISTEQFMNIVESLIRNYAYNWKPYTFHMETKNFTADWDKKDTEEYTKCRECVFYKYVESEHRIVSYHFTFDNIQWFLSYIFVKKEE